MTGDGLLGHEYPAVEHGGAAVVHPRFEFVRGQVPYRRDPCGWYHSVGGFELTEQRASLLLRLGEVGHGDPSTRDSAAIVEAVEDLPQRRVESRHHLREHGAVAQDSAERGHRAHVGTQRRQEVPHRGAERECRRLGRIGVDIVMDAASQGFALGVG